MQHSENQVSSQQSSKIPDRLRKDWCDAEEAMELTKMSRTTLWRKTRKNLIATQEYNGRALFSRRDIEDYLQLFAKKRRRLA